MGEKKKMNIKSFDKIELENLHFGKVKIMKNQMNTTAKKWVLKLCFQFTFAQKSSQTQLALQIYFKSR